MNTHKSILWLLFTSSFLLVNIPSLLSQEMGDGFFRLGILELTSTRYEDDHPFGQMTGDDSFDDPPVNIVPSTSWLEKVDEQTNRENVFQQYLFHALPPFSLWNTSYLRLLGSFLLLIHGVIIKPQFEKNQPILQNYRIAR